MAINVSKTLNTNCSIAVSGHMGPDGGKKINLLVLWLQLSITMNNIPKTPLGASKKYNIERTANLAILQLIKMIGKWGFEPVCKNSV